MKLKNFTIDHDILCRTLELIDIVKLFRYSAENGCKFGTKTFGPVTDSSGMFDEKITFLEDNTEIFKGDIDLIVANDPEWEGSKHFLEMCDWFNPDEITVYGILFVDKILVEFYKKCVEAGIKINKTPFSGYIDEAYGCIPSSSDEYTYMEMFIPKEEFIDEVGAPLVLFYTDATLFNAGVLEFYYQALDYATKVVKGEIKLEV